MDFMMRKTSWWIRLSRSVVAAIIATIHHESRIHRDSGADVQRGARGAAVTTTGTPAVACWKITGPFIGDSLVAFDQVSTRIGQVVGVRPEIGDPGDPAVVGELEEAQPGLRAFRAGELDPAGGVLALADDPLHGDVPVVREALHVEPEVGFPAANLLPGLGAAIEHVVGEHGTERVPVPGLGRGPV